MFTYAHVKWFYVYYLNYFINAKYNLTQETKEAHNVSLIDKNSLKEKNLNLSRSEKHRQG